MVACWSEHPNDRPSAKDVHQLASSLEFRHLMDVIEMGHREEFNQSNTLAAVSYRESKKKRKILMEINGGLFRRRK